MCIVNAHAAENCKSFHKILVVFSKNQIIEFVDELNWMKNRKKRSNAFMLEKVKGETGNGNMSYLYNSNYLPWGVLYGHTQNAFVTEKAALIHCRIEPFVLVRIGYVDGLQQQNVKNWMQEKSDTRKSNHQSSHSPLRV